VGPAHGAAARVESVEDAVVGADVDGRPEARGVLHGGRGVDVAAGLLGPGQPAVARREGVLAAVGGADVDAAERHGGGGVEVAGTQEAAGRPAVPHAAPGAGVDRLHVAAVVAEVQLAAGQRRAA